MSSSFAISGSASEVGAAEVGLDSEIVVLAGLGVASRGCDSLRRLRTCSLAILLAIVRREERVSGVKDQRRY